MLKSWMCSSSSKKVVVPSKGVGEAIGRFREERRRFIGGVRGMYVSKGG